MPAVYSTGDRLAGQDIAVDPCRPPVSGNVMRISWVSRVLTAIFTAVLAQFVVSADAATLSLVGSSTKVCQLIGDADWASGKPTAAKTLSNFGLDAVDLGFPVESGAGKLFFLFGDARPNGHPPNSIPSVPPDDALGWTTRSKPPDETTCLDLELATSAPKKFAHPVVVPAIKQGSFNVPSGGVVVNGAFYVFFWTDHCASPAILKPDASAPLNRPAPSKACAETSEINSVGLSVLAMAKLASPTAFSWTLPPDQGPLPDMPSGFVYVSAAKPPSETSPGASAGIPVFGVPRYRASVPYLALAPNATFGDPKTWSFFAGSAGGKPTWITRAQWESGRNANGQWAPPPGAAIYEPIRASENCIGEHSVTWNAPLHIWLLLYNCPGTGIETRFSPQPWGPWSAPVLLLSVSDSEIACNLIMSAAGCPGLNRRNYWPVTNGKSRAGGLYAPFVMNRFTQDATPAGATQTKRARIYWLLSTWNPYVVVVMQSTLAMKE